VLNTGVLDGKVDLGGGNDSFVNSGQLKGSALLGSGADFYDGRLGSATGAIDGGDGDDLLIGGTGADVLLGGDGGDVLVGQGSNHLTGGALADVFVLNAGAGLVVTDFSVGVDSFSLNGGLFLSATVSGTATVLTYAQGAVRVEGVTGLTLSQWNALVTDAVVLGSSSDDVLHSTARNEQIIGFTGHDTVSYADATQGVTVSLIPYGAQQTGGGGLDTLSGIENLTGSNYDDSLTAMSSGSVLRGLAGNDQLYGGVGDDILDGGLGNDLIDGRSGVDVVDYSQASVGVMVDLAYQIQNTVMGVDTLVSIEAVLGSAFDDVLRGGRLQGGAGHDLLLGTAGADLQIGDAGNDRLYGYAGADELRGDDGDDFISGGAGDDVLTGGAGDDVIVGGLGVDMMTGGAGADIFVFQSTADTALVPTGQSSYALVNQTDWIKDFETGIDHIDVSTLGVTTFTITQDIGYMTLHLQIPTGTLDIRFTGVVQAGDLILSSLTTTGAATNDRIVGGLGADGLAGGAGNDTILGDAGADTLNGGLGDDILDGGAGEDTAVFVAALASSAIAVTADGVSVRSAEGLDQLSSIEILQFADGVLKIEGLAQISALYAEFFGREVLGSEALVWQTAFAQGSTDITLRSVLAGTAAGQAHVAAEIDALYQSYFGRAAAASEIGVWTNAIAAGSTYADVRAVLVSTAYGQAHIGAATTDIYQTFFGRAPSAAEIKVWTDAVVSGVSLEDVRATLAGHPYGQAHVAAETTALYQTYFGRAAVAGEIQVWTDALVHGASYADIRAALVSTDYGQAHIAAETNVLYETYFGRAASADEQQVWTNAIVHGTTFDDLRATLVTHPYGQAYLAAETTTLYQTYFGRAPSSDEITVWKDAIVHGADFDTLTDALMSYGGSVGVQHLTGTAGSDHFVFTASSSDAVITGFSPGSDVIALQGLGADPLSHAHAVTYGGLNDVIIDYDSGLSLLLKGVSLADLHASDFLAL
jgi:Ca2+-binding RTX toxin-like protein